MTSQDWQPKLKFQGMAKQINNFERTWRDRNKCEKFFSKTPSVGELLSFDFWISRHFVTIFRNIRTFQDAISPKPIDLFQNCFSHLFLSRNVLSKLSIFVAITWNLNFAVNLATSFSRQKPLKSQNKKHRIFWNTEFYSFIFNRFIRYSVCTILHFAVFPTTFLPTVCLSGAEQYETDQQVE